MKIKFLLSRFLNGGIDTVLLRYLQHIDRHANQIELIIGTEYKGLQRFEDLIPSNVQVKYLLHENFLTKLPKLKLTQKLSKTQKIIDAIAFAPIRRAIQKTRFKKAIQNADAVVDFDCTYYSFLKNATCRKIAFFHFSINKYHQSNESKINRLCHKMMVYDKIVVICNKMAEEFAQRAPFLNNRISVIYNPVSGQQLEEKASEYTPPDGQYILSIARLEEKQKDFTTLINAYAAANKKTPLPPLYIIGEGQDAAMLKQLSVQHKLENKIIFLGFIQNPMPWIAKAKVFVLSSKYEGLPTVLIEALTLGRIIVSSDCPTGPAEILDNGNCGILVPPGDANAMARAIIQAVEDEDLRAKITSNIDRHKQLFSADYCIGQFMDLLKYWRFYVPKSL
ncbi:MAG: glycosyltransferase [Bacteroidales bacterium]|nr:glycosyltransferase [Bacteroidales bacterium]